MMQWYNLFKALACINLQTILSTNGAKWMKNILFLCTGNSCRSQMAEGLAKKHFSHLLNVYSAGTIAKGLDVNAIKAMKSHNVDISTQSSKTIEELPAITFELVITLCEDADKTCPMFLGAKTVHHGFKDPPRIALTLNDENEILQCYINVSNEIDAFIQKLPLLYPNCFS